MTVFVFGEVTKHVSGVHVWYTARFEMAAHNGPVPCFQFCATQLGGDEWSYMIDGSNVPLVWLMSNAPQRAWAIIRMLRAYLRLLLKNLEDESSGSVACDMWEITPGSPEYIQIVADALSCVPLPGHFQPDIADA